MQLNITVSIPWWAKGLWQIGSIRIVPDNAFAEEIFNLNGKATRINFPTDLNLWPKNDSIGNMYAQGSEWLELGSFGQFGATVDVGLFASQLMWDYAFLTQKFAAINTSDFVAHTVTTISIDSSKAVSAQASATLATEENASLTWLVIFLAALSIPIQLLPIIIRNWNRSRSVSKTKASSSPSDTEP